MVAAAQVSSREFDKLVERIDLNADGCLQFDEFAASLVDWQQVGGHCPSLPLSLPSIPDLHNKEQDPFQHEHSSSLLPGSSSVTPHICMGRSTACQHHSVCLPRVLNVGFLALVIVLQLIGCHGTNYCSRLFTGFTVSS